MTDEKKRCAEMVTDSSGWHQYRCSKPPKYHEDGKDWCGTHLPSRRKAKWEEKKAQWERERLEKQAKRDHEAALTAAREAVIQAAKDWYWHSPPRIAFADKLEERMKDLLELEASK